MTLTELIALVENTSTDKKLNDMVISYIKTAHAIGFEEGVKHVTEMQKKVFEVMGVGL